MRSLHEYPEARACTGPEDRPPTAYTGLVAPASTTVRGVAGHRPHRPAPATGGAAT